MCKSAAEGGQRCSSHAKKALDAASTNLKDRIAVTQACADSLAKADESTSSTARFRREAYLSEARSEERKARSEYNTALAGYASTPEGAASVSEELAKSDLSLGRSGTLRRAQNQGEYLRDRSTLVASGMTYSQVDAMDRSEMIAAAKEAKPLRVPKGSSRVMAKDASGRDRHALLSDGNPHWQGDSGKEWKVTSLSGEPVGTLERFSKQEQHSYGGGSRLAWTGKPKNVWDVSGPGVSRARFDYSTREDALNALFDGQERTAAAAVATA